MLRAVLLALCATSAAAETPTADIVILGEVHDNADAHLGQAAVLAALNPTAVVFEMLTAEDGRRADAERFMIPSIWEYGGWPDYTLYAPIFDALGDARIVGAAVPRDVVRAVHGEGPVALFGPDAARFGLDMPLPDDQQAARETLQYEAHCAAMPRDMMAGMVAIQRFRDAAFARAALDALETHGPPVAVIAGNGHARTDWGIPAMIARAAPDVTTHAIAFAESETDVPFDEIRIVPAADREDPCLSLTSR